MSAAVEVQEHYFILLAVFRKAVKIVNAGGKQHKGPAILVDLQTWAC